MNHELRRIIAAYRQARERGIASALATVVFVEGSSYRRVGARMLLADDGEWVGCVSGGCLERDLMRKATRCLETGRSVVATYDTREDGEGEARTPGAGLGCHGVIEILIEPIRAGEAHPTLEWMAAGDAQRRSGGLLLHPHQPELPAVRWDGDQVPADLGCQGAVADVARQAWDRFRGRAGAVGRTIPSGDGTARLFIERQQPATQVIVIGAGYDAVAMAALGVHLGHDVVVVDFRSGLPIPRRAFAGIARYLQCQPADLPQHLTIDASSAVIVMTHQAQDDRAVLPFVLESGPFYVGLLGPRKRGQQLLEACGYPEALHAPHVHTPIGLDIGAETPQEIALAVYAEIQAASSGHAGGELRALAGPIHARATA